jgi:hypothetical protein
MAVVCMHYLGLRIDAALRPILGVAA